MQITTSLMATAALLAAQPSVDTTPISSGHATTKARVFLVDEVLLPAMQAGVLMKLELENGTRVLAGVEVGEDALLGKLDDRDALARQKAAVLDHRVAVAEEEKSQVAIVAARKTVDVAEAEYEESIAVNKKVPGAVPPTQLRRQKLTEERARAEERVAVSDSKTAALTVDLRFAQVEVADINLERHQIRSPLAGEVVQVHRHVGEWVNPGDTILRIVRMDKLRVEGFLPLDQYNREEVAGQPVRVDLRLKDRAVTFEGVISNVSPLISSSGDYRISCEIENRKANGRWVMLPGMQADMTIELKTHQLAVTR